MKAFHHHRRHFHYLAISRVEFIDLDTIEAILEDLPNLKCLSVWSCSLIDLSKVRALIQIVDRVNVARTKVGKCPMDLDVAPPYRQGPIGERRGSYGITHSDPKLYNNWNTDIGNALAASLVSLLRAANQAGIQLCQPGRGFRNWLDKLPLFVNQAFNLCVTAAKFLANENTREAYASEVYPDPEDEGARAALIKRFNKTVALDLVAAAGATPINLASFEKEGDFTCTNCHENLPGQLFRYDTKQRSLLYVTCEGCELNSQLEYEHGNGQLQKRQLANWIWRGAPEVTLNWALGGSEEAADNWDAFLSLGRRLPTNDELLCQAEDLDDKVQIIIEKMNTFYNWSDKKPLMAEKRQLEEKIELLRIRAGFQRASKVCQGTDYDWDYLRRAYTWRGELERGEAQNNGPYQNMTILGLQRAFNKLN